MKKCLIGRGGASVCQGQLVFQIPNNRSCHRNLTANESRSSGDSGAFHPCSGSAIWVMVANENPGTHSACQRAGDFKKYGSSNPCRWNSIPFQARSRATSGLRNLQSQSLEPGDTTDCVAMVGGQDIITPV